MPWPNGLKGIECVLLWRSYRAPSSAAARTLKKVSIVIAIFIARDILATEISLAT
jgi:hypothetical protein